MAGSGSSVSITPHCRSRPPVGFDPSPTYEMPPFTVYGSSLSDQEARLPGGASLVSKECPLASWQLDTQSLTSSPPPGTATPFLAVLCLLLQAPGPSPRPPSPGPNTSAFLSSRPPHCSALSVDSDPPEQGCAVLCRPSTRWQFGIRSRPH